MYEAQQEEKDLLIEIEEIEVTTDSYSYCGGFIL
jgi:hypothetical protein